MENTPDEKTRLSIESVKANEAAINPDFDSKNVETGEGSASANEGEQVSRTQEDTAEKATVARDEEVSNDPFGDTQTDLPTAERALAGERLDSHLDAAAMERLARVRQQDRQMVEKTLGLNSVEPNIEREQVQIAASEAAKRDVWLNKAKPQTLNTSSNDNAVASDEIFTAEQSAKPSVPPDVERKFLRVGDKFYYPQNTSQVAFQDKGNKLETRSNGEQMAENLVRIAESRGWDEIKVSGSETFRREAWLEAAARGMHVKGYIPSELDLAALEKRLGQVEVNKVEKGREQFRGREKSELNSPTHPQSSPADTVKSRSEHLARDAADPTLLNGVLVQHGVAKYQNDEKNSDSYFVTLKDDKGAEKTAWGVDLGRAVEESSAEVGDRVSLHNEGRKEVIVKVPVRDSEGKVIGTEEKEVYRNTWNVSMAETFKKESPETGTAKHPELAGAYAAATAIDKQAEAHGLNPAQRAVVSARVRDNIVNSIERGDVPQVKRREQVEQQSEVKEEREFGR